MTVLVCPLTVSRDRQHDPADCSRCDLQILPLVAAVDSRGTLAGTGLLCYVVIRLSGSPPSLLERCPCWVRVVECVPRVYWSGTSCWSARCVPPQALYTTLYVVQSAARALVVRSDCCSISVAVRNPSRCIVLLYTKTTFLKTLMVVGGGFYVVLSHTIRR